jgi:hypothetical protein
MAPFIEASHVELASRQRPPQTLVELLLAWLSFVMAAPDLADAGDYRKQRAEVD